MEKNAKIYVAGHRGMVGSALVRRLQSEGYQNIVVRTSRELDLRNQQAVIDFLPLRSLSTCFWRRLK